MRLPSVGSRLSCSWLGAGMLSARFTFHKRNHHSHIHNARISLAPGLAASDRELGIKTKHLNTHT